MAKKDSANRSMAITITTQHMALTMMRIMLTIIMMRITGWRPERNLTRRLP